MVRFQCVSSLENGLDIKRAGEFVKEAIHSGGKVNAMAREKGMPN